MKANLAISEERIYEHEGRLSGIESDIKGIKNSINAIEVNHLSHLEKDVAWIKSRIYMFIGVIVAITFFSNLITSWIFR